MHAYHECKSVSNSFPDWLFGRYLDLVPGPWFSQKEFVITTRQNPSGRRGGQKLEVAPLCFLRKALADVKVPLDAVNLRPGR